jgi:hypothetical protein
VKHGGDTGPMTVVLTSRVGSMRTENESIAVNSISRNRPCVTEVPDSWHQHTDSHWKWTRAAVTFIGKGVNAAIRYTPPMAPINCATNSNTNINNNLGVKYPFV